VLVVLIGPPGAGKSKQSQLLKDRDHIEWVSVGQLLRQQDNPAYNEQMKRGELVDDAVVNQVIEDHVNALDRSQVVVLDGSPRHLGQARWIMDYAERSGHEIKRVLHLQIDESVARERLLARGRQDDNATSIAERLDEYRDTILPILAYYEEQAVPVVTIDGNRPVETVFAELDEVIHHVYQNQN
jgi:adenylate kinase